MSKFHYKVFLVAALTIVLYGCDIKQTQEGKLPDVDVDVKEGQLPKYDIDGPDVDVRMKEKTIKVPDIDVDLPEDN